MKAKNSIIFEHWRQFAELTSGRQHEYFVQEIKDGHQVKVVRAKDVFTKDELAMIESYCKIEEKQCYCNAYRLTNLFPDRVEYVEGEVEILNGGLGIEHAWNLVDGEHYVDLTFEFALNEDVTKTTYVALGEYNIDKIRKVARDTRVYGGVYNYYTIEKIKEKERKTKKH